MDPPDPSPPRAAHPQLEGDPPCPAHSATVLFLCAVFPLCAGGDRGLPPPVVPAGFGVNIHFTDPGPGEMERFAEAGYRLVRMDFAWEAVERQAGRYDFGAYDRLLGHLERAGARPIFILDYGNRLYDHGSAPQSDPARAAFAKFAARRCAALPRARRDLGDLERAQPRASSGSPRPTRRPTPSSPCETARAVRAADPEAVILAPGSSGFPWEFLETVFAAGLLEQIDAVSVHPYRESALRKRPRQDYGRLRALIARYASPERRHLPIISSEWGYSTAEGAVSEAGRPSILARQWLTNLAAGVNLSIFYDWRDDGDNPNDREHRFGTVRRNLEPKPSFLAAQKLIRALRGYDVSSSPSGPSPSEWKLLFEQAERPGGLMLVEWSIDPKSGDARQTPRFTPSPPIGRGPTVCAGWRTSDSLAGPLAEKQGHPAVLPHHGGQHRGPARSRPPGRDGRAITPRRLSLDLTLQPGETASRSLTFPDAGLRVEHRTVALKLTWNDEALPALAPLERVASRPAPDRRGPPGSGPGSHRRKPRAAGVRGQAPGRGRRDRRDRRPGSSHQQGASSGSVPAPAGSRHPTRSCWRMTQGHPVAQTSPARFEAMAGFPTGPESSTGDGLDPVRGQRSAVAPSAGSVRAGADAPAPFALEVPYHFDPGWRYLAVSSRRPMTIPAGANGAIVWVRGNPSGDSLRCRFHDSTGQTFQVDLGRSTGPSWRPLADRLPARPTGRIGAEPTTAFLIHHSPGRHSS